jgi:hypothetical protein
MFCIDSSELYYAILIYRPVFIYFYFIKRLLLVNLVNRVAADAFTRDRIRVSAAMSEILKFFGNYDDIKIRGQKKRSQN